MDYLLPEWEEPIDEAELEAIEAAFLSSKRRKPSPSTSGEGDAIKDNPDAHSLCHHHKGRRPPVWGHKTADRSRENTSPCLGKQIGWSLVPPPCGAQVKVRYPLMTFGGCIVYSRTVQEVEKAASDLLDLVKSKRQNENPASVGFDIEWKPTFRRGEGPKKAAVIQLCMDNSHCHVMHVIHSGIPPLLRSLLEDNSSVKVGVCIGNDAMKILKDYNVHIESLEDLSNIANLRLGGTFKKWSLSSLTEMLICKQLVKPSKIRMGNWEVDILSKEQLLYAATDAFVSWYLYQVLKTFPSTASGDQVSTIDSS